MLGFVHFHLHFTPERVFLPFFAKWNIFCCPQPPYFLLPPRILLWTLLFHVPLLSAQENLISLLNRTHKLSKLVNCTYSSGPVLLSCPCGSPIPTHPHFSQAMMADPFGVSQDALFSSASYHPLIFPQSRMSSHCSPQFINSIGIWPHSPLPNTHIPLRHLVPYMGTPTYGHPSPLTDSSLSPASTPPPFWPTSVLLWDQITIFSLLLIMLAHWEHNGNSMAYCSWPSWNSPPAVWHQFNLCPLTLWRPA